MGRLRVLLGRELCEILMEHGFQLVRQRGSHVVMQRVSPGSTTTIPMPDHKDLRTGTMRAIIRQSGPPRELFELRTAAVPAAPPAHEKAPAEG